MTPFTRLNDTSKINLFLSNQLSSIIKWQQSYTCLHFVSVKKINKSP